MYTASRIWFPINPAGPQKRVHTMGICSCVAVPCAHAKSISSDWITILHRSAAHIDAGTQRERLQHTTAGVYDIR